MPMCINCIPTQSMLRILMNSYRMIYVKFCIFCIGALNSTKQKEIYISHESSNCIFTSSCLFLSVALKMTKSLFLSYYTHSTFMTPSKLYYWVQNDCRILFIFFRSIFFCLFSIFGRGNIGGT